MSYSIATGVHAMVRTSQQMCRACRPCVSLTTARTTALAAQGGHSPPMRHQSDVAMSSLSGTEGAAPVPADDAHDSAFLHQHPFDNVERACAMDNLRHPSDTSDAGTITAATAAALAAAAAAAAAAAGAEGGNGNKRSRGAAEDAAPAGVAGQRALYHQTSQYLADTQLLAISTRNL